MSKLELNSRSTFDLLKVLKELISFTSKKYVFFVFVLAQYKDYK